MVGAGVALASVIAYWVLTSSQATGAESEEGERSLLVLQHCSQACADAFTCSDGTWTDPDTCFEDCKKSGLDNRVVSPTKCKWDCTLTGIEDADAIACPPANQGVGLGNPSSFEGMSGGWVSRTCGNGFCNELEGENCITCPGDCQCVVCGDGSCHSTEICSCFQDCGSCGDTVCQANAEDCTSCPSDCGACANCGNGVQEGTLGEDCFNCPEDFGACQCGDGACTEEAGEDCSTCSQDCGSCCGNRKCEPSRGEDCSTCSQDCGSCCGNRACEPSRGEDCSSCSTDCGSCCGNSLCEDAKNESCTTCPGDCGSCASCGDGSCIESEVCNCTDDCHGPCENGVCEPGEADVPYDDFEYGANDCYSTDKLGNSLDFSNATQVWMKTGGDDFWLMTEFKVLKNSAVIVNKAYSPYVCLSTYGPECTPPSPQSPGSNSSDYYIQYTDAKKETPSSTGSGAYEVCLKTYADTSVHSKTDSPIYVCKNTATSTTCYELDKRIEGTCPGDCP